MSAMLEVKQVCAELFVFDPNRKKKRIWLLASLVSFESKSGEYHLNSPISPGCYSKCDERMRQS